MNLNPIPQFPMQGLNQMSTMARAMANPQASTLQQMVQSNPHYAEVMQYISQNGGDAKAWVYNILNQRGKDVNQFVNQVKGMLNGMK